jgi:cellulose biosynthesis protein BcsQ
MTGTVNAICASTHVLIPTILAGLSASAALRTLNVFFEIRRHLCPGLQVLGILPTFVSRADGFNSRERENMQYLKENLDEYWPHRPVPYIFENEVLYRKEAVAKSAGQNIAYLKNDADTIQMFKEVGSSIAGRIFNAYRGTEAHTSISATIGGDIRTKAAI